MTRNPPGCVRAQVLGLLHHFTVTQTGYPPGGPPAPPPPLHPLLHPLLHPPPQLPHPPPPPHPVVSVGVVTQYFPSTYCTVVMSRVFDPE